MTAVTNYPRITLSSGLVGVVVDTSIDYTFKGRCMCEAMQHLLASAVAAMLRDPDDTSRCLLDYEAASQLTDEDYKAFWKALGCIQCYCCRHRSQASAAYMKPLERPRARWETRPFPPDVIRND